ncbi:hypothetical protein EGT07_08085 [Herbaspirillum sp. HC18]|nr:hypothetical protein EGT07_08085 [Herbaspirillum sp. HC18]
MANNTFDAYKAWITPTPGDPTYSLLKAHLLFEELLRAYLSRILPYSSALEGARLTFVQLLAVARASSTHAQPDHWMWKAIGDLNKLRNMLSHEARPKALGEKLNEYISLVETGLTFPLPESNLVRGSAEANACVGHLYSATDVVTFGLYYFVASTLGFDMSGVDHPQQGTKSTDVEPNTSMEGI